MIFHDTLSLIYFLLRKKFRSTIRECKIVSLEKLNDGRKKYPTDNLCA